MRKHRKAISIILVLSMLIAMFPAAAIEGAGCTPNSLEGLISICHVNPEYEKLGVQFVASAAEVSEDAVEITVGNLEDAVACLREQMENRVIEVRIIIENYTFVDTEQASEDWTTTLYGAWEHTGIPTQGDYIKHHYGQSQGKIHMSGSAAIFDYTVTYDTTLEQETLVGDRIHALFESWNDETGFYTLPDNERIRIIYDYICENVDYDYENLNDSTYTLKYSAYAALINGKAVCQGYANLFYRMALEAGIDTRIITGMAGGGYHSWNIVELSNKFYYLDSAWDAPSTSYSWFLLGSDNYYLDHAPNAEFLTTEFLAVYPVSENDYTLAELAINKSLLFLDPGETETLVDTVRLENPEDLSVCWISSDTKVASVMDGVVTAHAPGMAVITAAVADTVYSVSCDVTVKALDSVPSGNIASGFCGSEGDGTNLAWSLAMDGTLTISGTGVMADYYATTMPWYGYKEYISTLVIKPGATSIGKAAFNGCSGLTDVSIPDSVTDIGSGSFGDCRGLTEITLPDGVTRIGSHAFSGCTGLTSIAIPNSLTVIEESVFFGCSGLTEVTIPNSVMTIEDSAFAYCEQLSGVVIPESVTSIGDFAFDQCAAMQSVTIPDSVASIGRGAFRDCSSMQSISVSSGNLNYCDKDGVLFNKDRTVVVAYPAGKTDETYEIPAGVTTIGELAFIHSVNLTSITIPDGVTSIGAAAFGDCFVLTTVTIPDSVAEIAWAAFYDDDGLSTVYYGGTEEQWNAIAIDTENDPLLNATIICLEEDENGPIVIISAAFGADIFTVDAGIATYSLPVEVIYRSDASFSFLSEVPVILSVEGGKADMSYSENGYEYDWGGFFFSRAYFTRDEEHEALTLVGINDGLNDCVIHAGDYAITITIPAEYMENGQALTLEVLLEVIPTEDNYVDLDSLAVSLEARDWTVAQETANTEEAVKAWIEDQIGTIGLNGAEFTLTMTSFVPAEAGTKADLDGTNGSFAFSVVLNADNGVPCTEMTVSITTGVITATTYVPAEYTVTYNANGGSGTIAPTTVTEGENYTVAGQGDLKREGYEFAGWNTAADGSGEAYAEGDELIVTGDITLYAQWTEAKDPAEDNIAALKALELALEAYNWTVAQETANTEDAVKAWIEQQIGAMELNGAEFAVEMLSVASAVAGTLSDLDGTNGSFAFEVALTKGSREDRTYAENTVTITSGVITATVYVPAEYTVTYDANGGTGTVPASITETEGTVITVAGRGELENGDYEFVGWNTEKNGTGIAYQSGAQMTVKSDTTLYAQWRISNRTVSGTITGHKGVTYVSVTAKLVGTDGVEYIGTVGEGVPDGQKTQYSYSVNAPEGQYTLIVVAVTDEGVEVTRTRNVNLKNKDATQHVNLPNGQAKAKTNVVVEQDAPQVLAGGLDSIVDETIEGNENVTEVEVALVVEAVDETTTEASEIREQTESDELEFVELTIRKEVTMKSGETETEALSELKETIELVIPFDCEGKKDIKVHRYHGDRVDTLTTVPNADGEWIELGGDHIVIHAKKFSTYAIGYSSDPAPENPVVQYTITFDSNGGFGIMEPVVVEENSRYTLPVCGFTAPEGKEFKGWDVGGTAYKVGDTVTVSGNITVSAVWENIAQEPEQPEIPVIPVISVCSVTVAAGIEGGRISVSAAAAAQGTTVTITAAPNEGYTLDTLTVTDRGGSPVALTDQGNGEFTFVMPADSVTVYATFEKTAVQWIDPFTDVEDGAGYYDAVAFVAKNGIMNGYDSDTFGIGDTLTRAQLTQILYNLENRPEVAGSSEFRDVEDDEWYADAVIWASANGIIGGYGDGRFGPNDPITREQLATILYRYEQYKGGGFKGMWMFLLDYPDRGEVSEWAYEAVCWMTMNGIITGIAEGGATKLCPTGTATRTQVAMILWRFCEKAAND